MNAPAPRRLIALALFAFTAAGVAYYPTLTRSDGAAAPGALPGVIPAANPAANPGAGPAAVAALPPPVPGQPPVVEAVFVLDTTGSMGGLIQTAKDKIWSIASTLAAARPAPILRMGLVAYRDRGDDYVTRVVELSPDLDALYTVLMQLQAQGGGDGPESVNQALNDAVARMGWSRDPTAYRVVFLVGDAPPHLDYPNDVPYATTLVQARRLGIRVNAIQCGQQPDTAQEWRRIAQLGDGGYFSVEQAGGAVAIATPYDGPLARLSEALDGTRVYYGDADERARRESRDGAAKAAQAAAAPAALARRAELVASASGTAARAADLDLVEAVASGRVDLAKLPAAQLPAPLASLEPEARAAALQETARERARLRQRIDDLAARRDAYVKDKLEAAGGAEDSLDHQIWRAVRAQGTEAGLGYGEAGPRY